MRPCRRATRAHPGSGIRGVFRWAGEKCLDEGRGFPLRACHSRPVVPSFPDPRKWQPASGNDGSPAGDNSRVLRPCCPWRPLTPKTCRFLWLQPCGFSSWDASWCRACREPAALPGCRPQVFRPWHPRRPSTPKTCGSVGSPSVQVLRHGGPIATPYPKTCGSGRPRAAGSQALAPPEAFRSENLRIQPLETLRFSGQNAS